MARTMRQERQEVWEALSIERWRTWNAPPDRSGADGLSGGGGGSALTVRSQLTPYARAHEHAEARRGSEASARAPTRPCVSDVTTPGEPSSRPPNLPAGIRLSGPDLDLDSQMLIALGAVVRTASRLEDALRSLFCALEGTKYAAITAAGQSAGWLLDTCAAILSRRADVTEAQREQLRGLLADARAAMERRNRYVHDVWVFDPGADQLLKRSHRKATSGTFQSVTLEEMVTTARKLFDCCFDFSQWVLVVLGPESVAYDAQLGWEEHLASLSP